MHGLMAINFCQKQVRGRGVRHQKKGLKISFLCGISVKLYEFFVKMNEFGLRSEIICRRLPRPV